MNKSQLKLLIKEVVRQILLENKKVLNENMTYRELFDLTTPARKDRSKHVNTRFLKIVPVEDEKSWTFRYKSGPGADPNPGIPYKGAITFLKEENNPTNYDEDSDVKVDCECKDFRFRFAWNDANQNASQVGNNSLNKCINRRPQPAYDYGEGLCKHLSALKSFLESRLSSIQQSHHGTRPQNIFEGLNKLVKQGPITIKYND